MTRCIAAVNNKDEVEGERIHCRSWSFRPNRLRSIAPAGATDLRSAQPYQLTVRCPFPLHPSRPSLHAKGCRVSVTLVMSRSNPALSADAPRRSALSRGQATFPSSPSHHTWLHYSAQTPLPPLVQTCFCQMRVQSANCSCCGSCRHRVCSIKPPVMNAWPDRRTIYTSGRTGQAC